MKVLTALQTKRIEQISISLGISGERLMENAGSAATRVIRENFETINKRVVIVTGQGNNGGDGFVVARKLKEYGANVFVVMAAGITVTADSSKMFSRAKNSQISMVYYYDNEGLANSLIASADIVVDAIFGTGFHGAPERDIAKIIEHINKSNAKRVALDIPSGVVCDTGEVKGAAVKADLTVSFIGYKPCHFAYSAADFCGKTVAVSIGTDDGLIDSALAEVISTEDALLSLKKIPKNAHKGIKGLAAIVAGSYGMAGAPVISARAAMGSGAGLVELLVPDKIYPIIASSVIEAVFKPLKDKNGFIFEESVTDGLFDRANSLLIGPGLGNNSDTSTAVHKIISSVNIPTVIDADGLNAIATNVQILNRLNQPIIITPHLGEMSRLMGCSIQEIEADRIAAAKNFSDKYGVITLLKGAYTVIAEPKGRVYINTTGNEGMATAGSGDMLAGMIAAFLANGMEPFMATVAAACLHGAAGDNAALRLGVRGMTVSDILHELPNIFK